MLGYAAERQVSEAQKRTVMATRQGDLTPLKESAVRELLESTIPAMLGYVSPDDRPRVATIWFLWNRGTFVFGT